MNNSRTVAIVGASANREKFGNISVRAHQRAGYTVYPVNPRGGEIEGLVAYTSVSAIPAHLDRVSLYLPPELGLAVVDEIAAKGCGELWLNPGSDSPELVARCRQLRLHAIVGCSIVQLGYSPSEFM